MEELALKWMTGTDAVAVWLLALAVLVLLAVTLRQGDWPNVKLRLNRVTAATAVAFLSWLAGFVGLSLLDMSFGLLLVANFLVLLPASAVVARLATGVSPYKAIFR